VGKAEFDESPPHGGMERAVTDVRRAVRMPPLFAPPQNEGAKKALSDTIRRTLEEEIFLGVIQPGERLDEQKEAERFDVSRTPVREALLYLASAGLVKLESRKGATVARLSVPQIIEMMDVLAHMEQLCAGLAARNMSASELRKIEKLHRKCVDLVTKRKIDDYFHIARWFHETMYAGSHNSFLSENCTNLRTRIFPYLRCQLHSSGRAENCIAEQQLLFDALMKRKEEDASGYARDHLRIQQSVFSNFMSALEKTGMASAAFGWAPTGLLELWQSGKA
jgi:DNA-binding GntR family transcriptional regulator